MKNNFYIVCNSNGNLFPDVFFGLKEKHKNIVSFNIDEFSQKTRKIIFSKFYTHVAEEGIEASKEYKHIFKSIEEQYIEQILLTVSKNNKNTNVLFHGDFEMPFSRSEWINEIENKLRAFGWNIYFFFLGKKEFYNSKIVQEIAKTKKIALVFTIDDLQNLTQGFKDMKEKKEPADLLKNKQEAVLKKPIDHDKLFSFFTALLLLTIVIGSGIVFYITKENNKKVESVAKRNMIYDYQYAQNTKHLNTLN